MAADLGATTYSAVSWTAGDVITEAKLDSMVANDQAYDSHAAQGLLLNNDKAFAARNAAASETYNLAKINSSDQIEYGAVGLSIVRKGNWDGWISAGETWTYASASTINVPAGAASKYAKGDKIKLTQTTVKYFSVVAVADTLLTVTGGTGYTVANAAISLNSYSHDDSPVGFPSSFAYTPTLVWTAGTAPSGAVGSTKANFKVVGNMVHLNVAYVDFATPGATVTGVTVSLPFAVTTQFQFAHGSISSAGIPNTTIGLLQNGNIFLACSSVAATRLVAGSTYIY